MEVTGKGMLRTRLLMTTNIEEHDFRNNYTADTWRVPSLLGRELGSFRMGISFKPRENEWPRARCELLSRTTVAIVLTSPNFKHYSRPSTVAPYERRLSTRG